MKAYICDICQNQAPIIPNSYDLPPKGWYSVSKMNGSYITTHICGVACLQAYTDRERLAIAPAEPLPKGVEANG